MEPLGNDRWRASFVVDEVGRHDYTVAAWIDHFGHLAPRPRQAARRRPGRHGRPARSAPSLVDAAVRRAAAGGAHRGRGASSSAGRPASAKATAARGALDDDLDARMRRHPDRDHVTTYEPELEIVVDPVHARFSAWYELFPRSTSPKPGPPRHAPRRHRPPRRTSPALGFDVLYLPPIHPIGRDVPQGPRTTSTSSRARRPGRARGRSAAPEGGHTAVHPDLGTLDDFDALVEAAASARHRASRSTSRSRARPTTRGSREHPTWFRQRPDGTIQYAENPPKKYQDIYPFDFETRGLAARCGTSSARRRSSSGSTTASTIFRVDNPHTKPFPFWEWCIGEVKARPPGGALPRRGVHPAEGDVPAGQARVHPVLHVLHVAQRTSRSSTEYFERADARRRSRDFFRPNFWPNTPDILHEHAPDRRPADVRGAARPRGHARARPTASTARRSSCSSTSPREPGSEEYLDSEKYELRTLGPRATRQPARR